MPCVAAVSNLASAAGDWQSVSSRGRPHKSSQSRVEQESELRRRIAVCSVLSVIRIKDVTKPCGCLAILGACVGNPRVAAIELLHRALALKQTLPCIVGCVVKADDLVKVITYFN